MNDAMSHGVSNSLREQLTRVRRHDPWRKVFGAAKHQYHSTRVSAGRIARLEETLGVSLPPEYREFLLNVGYGAGPYYGVWSPSESMAELQMLMRDFEREKGRAIRPAAEFPLRTDDLRQIEAGFAAGQRCPAVKQEWPCDGGLPICHHGCTYYSVLVLTGEYAGRVWDLSDGGEDTEWLPASRAPGWSKPGTPYPHKLSPLPAPPTFGEWYMGWIERCLTDLPEPTFGGRFVGRMLECWVGLVSVPQRLRQRF